MPRSVPLPDAIAFPAVLSTSPRKGPLSLVPDAESVSVACALLMFGSPVGSSHTNMIVAATRFRSDGNVFSDLYDSGGPPPGTLVRWTSTSHVPVGPPAAALPLEPA